ncbi:hypothetical protein P4654_02120 [Niallia taxi]|uniref:hypothetical protein n=1 Tax=Niallia taxi TaxID=2499688 RepID=UPI002E1DFDEF|nr:hypothetical protein [Niallia taxi]MED4118096.1 hypothetical protein [Niallia taxi]
MKTMVFPTQVSNVANDIGVTMDSKTFELGSRCYDSGMVSMIRMIAGNELRNVSESDEIESKITKECRETVEGKFQQLLRTLSPEHKKLFMEYEDEFNSYLGCTGDDRFITGFISGFSYLLSEMRFGSGQDFLL